MPLQQLWMLAIRDLGRNRRRSLLSTLAVALGLALLIVMNGFIAGVMDESLQNSIRLRTGHVQLRAPSYQEDTLSLEAKDMLLDPEALAARVNGIAQVQAAAPVLWASAILNTPDDSVGVQLVGIDTASPLYDPIRTAIVAGTFVAPDDRNDVLIGKSLADSLGVGVGQRLSLALVNGDGRPDEGTFVVRGLFATGIPTYDQNAVLMPLRKAQAFAATSRHASAIVVLLHDEIDSEAVAAALRGPDVSALSWRDLNAVFVEAFQTSMNFYVILDAIVILIVAVLIANTLLMSVFERIREMGILAALGMKGRHLLQMFLLEAASLGLAGVIVGVVLGSLIVGYLASVGISITDQMASVAGNSFALTTTMHARFVPTTFAGLALATLLIVMLGAIYPAWYASRLEPVQALRAS